MFFFFTGHQKIQTEIECLEQQFSDPQTFLSFDLP